MEKEKVFQITFPVGNCPSLSNNKQIKISTLAFTMYINNDKMIKLFGQGVNAKLHMRNNMQLQFIYEIEVF